MIFYFKAHASSAPVSVSSRAPPRLNWMWSHFSSKQKKTTQSLLRFQWKKQQQQTSRLKRFCANAIIVFVYSSFKLNGLAACISWVTLNNQYLGLQIGILGKKCLHHRRYKLVFHCVYRSDQLTPIDFTTLYNMKWHNNPAQCTWLAVCPWV